MNNFFCILFYLSFSFEGIDGFKIIEFAKNCDQIGMMNYLKEADNGFLYYEYLLKKGDFSQAEYIRKKNKDKEKFIGKVNLDLMYDYYKMNFKTVVKKYNYNKISKRMRDTKYLFSLIILKEKSLLEKLIKDLKKEKNYPITAYIGEYFLYGKKVPNQEEEKSKNQLNHLLYEPIYKYIFGIEDREKAKMGINECYKHLEIEKDILNNLLDSLP